MKKIENGMVDIIAMRYALAQARKSFQIDEVPIGAVIVDLDGNVVARAYNQVEKKKTQLAHAELQVLTKVSKKMKRWRLNDLTMYVTLQPCAMCMGALVLSRIKRSVYAANSPLFGCNLDKLDWFGIYKDSLPVVDFQEHVESINLLKEFFRKQRRRIKNGC